MDEGRQRSEGWSALLPSRAHVEMVMGSNCELSSGNSIGTSTSMAMEAGAARWSAKRKDARDDHNPGTAMPRRAVAEHRPGWGHKNTSVRSETMALDRMMAMYESQITNDHIFAANQSSSATDLGQDGALSTSDDIPGVNRKLVGTSSDLKRMRMELATCEEADLGESCGWSHPLKLLVRKGLSVSDVGELGRVIIPKRFAESMFQHLEAKEGTLLEMEDYNGSKRWSFRFKWWTNNRSRMYVLENTGEFIKYHSLKEHDIFAVYEDNVKRLVVRGHKGTDLHSMLDDDVQGSNPGSSTKEEESSLII